MSGVQRRTGGAFTDRRNSANHVHFSLSDAKIVERGHMAAHLGVGILSTTTRDRELRSEMMAATAPF